MNTALLFIHGKDGSAEEAEHYKVLFPKWDIIGFDYRSQTPWEAQSEFPDFFDKIRGRYGSVVLIAYSIGAYFAMNALSEAQIEKAYFVSPIVDMGKLISDMIQWIGASERDLQEQGTIETDFGETLSWEYLLWVKNHPISWKVPTSVLYGSADNLQSIGTIKEFVDKTGADLTVMENGEHWFHTKEQMAFLDDWIKER